MVLFQEQYYSFLSLFLFIFLALIIYSNTSIASTSINVYCPFTCNSKSLDKTGSNGITYLNINKSEAISEDKVVDKNTVTLGDNEALSEIEAIGKEEDAPIVEKETPRINDVSTSIEVSGVTDATFPSANDVDYVISKQIYDEFYYKNFNQRILYIDAIEAYQNGDFDKLSNLVNNELKDYILVDNLKYLLLLSPKAKFNEILEFINSDNHLDLSASLRAYYVRYYGYKRNYSKLFKISKKQPNHNSLKCIWVNAKLDTKSSTKKQKNKIISNIRKDYINGEVIPGSCRGIVDNLVKQKKITADDIINRLKNIYWTRGSENRFKETIEHLNLIKDNRKKYSKAIALLKKLYNQPEKYNNFVPKGMKTVAVSVFKRFARTNPKKSITEYDSFKKKYKISKSDEKEIKRIMLTNALYERNNTPFKYIDKEIQKYDSDKLYEMRIRLAIWNKNYKDVLKYIGLLSKSSQNHDNMIYWKARSLEELGKTKEAFQNYSNLATRRSFYGFVAADKLNLPYSVAYKKFEIPNDTSISTLSERYPHLAKLYEYIFINDKDGIWREWEKLMKGANINDARVLAHIISQRGFSELAIWQSIHKKDWDILDLRFPIVYNNLYEEQSKQQGISKAYLYGITRQESMMNPNAVSSVGARGLMQLMPQTAKYVSKKNKYDYKNVNELYKPEVNVKLGASYLNEMMSNFSGNRIYVTAGYNAGPHRSLKWQSKDGVKRDYVTYIETIPFTETRNYVQKVLFYTYLYQILLGETNPIFLTDTEKNSDY
jgi:soluble lytic murein transglycosylase